MVMESASAMSWDVVTTSQAMVVAFRTFADMSHETFRLF